MGVIKNSRKTPVEHTVHRHKRMGKWVDDFQRGKGKHPNRSVRVRPKKLVSGRSMNPHGVDGDYRVRLFYDRRNSENFKLTSRSFQQAQKEGFSMSDNVIEPNKVSIRSI